jgi:hypothetical protein
MDVVEIDMAQFEILTYDLPESTEEIHEKLLDNASVGSLNPQSLKYEAGPCL